MEPKIGGLMEKHIDFFRNALMGFSLLIIISCNSKEQILKPEKYYNFSCDTVKTDSSLQISSKFGKLDSNLPYYTIEIKKVENKLLKSFFSINGLDYKTPSSFRNFNEYGFIYSIMPKYTDSNFVAQKTNYGDTFIYLIKGENPFCNGSNCQSYNLHLLALKSNKLKLNQVYQFDSRDNKFEDFRLVLIKDKLLFLNKNTVIDTLRF